jgi:predicted aspartyl protease
LSGRNIAYIPIELRVQIGSTVNAVKAQGIVDTGADMTCVPLKVIEQLGLNPIGAIDIATPNGIVSTDYYCIDIAFERILLPRVSVIGINIDLVLLGRDSLKGFTVVLEPSGAVVLYETTK